VDQAVLSALNSIAMLGVLAHNRHRPDRPLMLKSQMVDKSEVKTLEGERTLPRGFRPTFGLKYGYLVLASSPEVFQRFATKPGMVLGPETTPLIRVSLRDWRTFLKDRHEKLTREAARRNHLPTAEVGRRLDELLTRLQWFDHIEVGVRRGPGAPRLTIHLRSELSLRGPSLP
jgi:hypothetical protein